MDQEPIKINIAPAGGTKETQAPQEAGDWLREATGGNFFWTDPHMGDFEKGQDLFPRGQRIEVRTKKGWLPGSVVETVEDNDRAIAVTTDQPYSDNKDFYDGRGATVGVYMNSRRGIWGNLRREGDYKGQTLEPRLTKEQLDAEAKSLETPLYGFIRSIEDSRETGITFRNWQRGRRDQPFVFSLDDKIYHVENDSSTGKYSIIREDASQEEHVEILVDGKDKIGDRQVAFTNIHYHKSPKGKGVDAPEAEIHTNTQTAVAKVREFFTPKTS